MVDWSKNVSAFAMTSCVVGSWRGFCLGGRQRTALAIRSRSAQTVRAKVARISLETGWHRSQTVSWVCHERCGRLIREEQRNLHEEGMERVLEGGDRTVGVREGGLEMCNDLGSRPVRRLGRQPGRQFGRPADSQEGRADLALAQVEPSPDALPGSIAEMAVGSADGCDQGAGHRELEEAPQAAAGQAEPANFVGTPDAESPPAARSAVAIAAKDPPGADGFLPGAAVVKAAQIAVADERANNLAMRTRRQLEPLRQGVPFLVTAAKPSLHAKHASKNVIVPAWGSSGV